MAKYHYIITSKKRLVEEKEEQRGIRTIKICEVIEINENGKDIYTPYSIKNGKQNWFFNILLGLAIFFLCLYVIVMIIGKDWLGIKNGIYALTNNFFAIASLLMILYSFPKLRECIGKRLFRFGKIGNKLYVALFIYFLALYLAAILNRINHADKYADILSLICLTIAFFRDIR